MATRLHADFGDDDKLDAYFRDEYRAEEGAYTERRPAYTRGGEPTREARFWGPRLPVGYYAEDDFARTGTGAPLNSAADRFYAPPDEMSTRVPRRFPDDRTIVRSEYRRTGTGPSHGRHRGAGLIGAAERFYEELTDAIDPRIDARHRGRGPRNYVRSDERILEDVHERLTLDPHLDASEIGVVVKDREVTLSGNVASRADKRRAEDIAEDVSCVVHVQNNVRVRT
jgi:BON domain